MKKFQTLLAACALAAGGLGGAVSPAFADGIERSPPRRTVHRPVRPQAQETRSAPAAIESETAPDTVTLTGDIFTGGVGADVAAHAYAGAGGRVIVLTGARAQASAFAFAQARAFAGGNGQGRGHGGCGCR
ncbi:MAG: hypothetical protein AB7O04_00400 [Hyphomonadaceae bacterium]